MSNFFHLKNTHILLMLFLSTLSIISCHTPEKMTYFADAERDSLQTIPTTYSSTIHTGDRLYIYVASHTPETTIPFNQETNKIVTTTIGTESAINQNVTGNTQSPDIDNQETTTYEETVLNTQENAKAAGYLVSDSGYIVFPIIGRLNVAGITRDSLAGLIKTKLIEGHYVADPVVTVRLLNFRVAVLGEVTHPDQLQVQGERLTLLEALALTGDLTIYGQRENVMVLREKDGQYTIGRVDLTSKKLFTSPYYYLQQNDIVYVEPNKKKKKEAAYNPNIIRYITLAVSAGTLTTSTFRTIIAIMQNKLTQK